MALATRVACNEEGDGKSGRQATAMRAMATMWVMATAMRLAGNKAEKGKGSKGNGNGNGGWQASKRMAGECTMSTTKRVMVIATRVAGK